MSGMTLLGWSHSQVNQIFDKSISLRWHIFFFKLTFVKKASHEILVAWLSWVRCAITVSLWHERFFCFQTHFHEKASHEIWVAWLSWITCSIRVSHWDDRYFFKLTCMKKVSHEILVAWLSWVRCTIRVSLWHEIFFFSNSLSWKSISRDTSGVTLLDEMYDVGWLWLVGSIKW